jgi:aspartate kinase
MPLLVMKFGGTSVADLARIENAAKKVQREVERGYDVIVIVSAMSGKTNELVGWVEQTSKLYDAREYDAVVSARARMSPRADGAAPAGNGRSGAVSWQGWQVPINTTRRPWLGPVRVDPARQHRRQVRRRLQGRRGAPAFRACQRRGPITTLGRGGSDTTAVAFAAAFGAERCDIYTDVDGVYTTDPRITPRRASWTRSPSRRCWNWPPGRQGAADPLGRTGDALQGAAARAVLVRGYRRNFGTLVCDEDEIMESKVVSGVAYSRDEAKMTLVKVEDRPGVAAAIFGRWPMRA